MAEPVEEVTREIPVIARLTLGSEHLRLFLTNRRIIVAHVGKRGAGALATTTLFGRLSGAFEDLFKSGKESLRKRKLEKLSPAEILAADKDNFFIDYDEVVSVALHQRLSSTGITLLTKQEKFEFSTRLGFETVLGLLDENLGSKISAGRLGATG